MKNPTYQIRINEGSKRSNEYILVCNFFNEEASIPSFLASLAKQTIQPNLIFLINDGSKDKSGLVATETARKLGFSYCIAEFPPKSKGNLDTIGQTWSLVQPKIHEYLKDVNFLAIADVDTTFSPDYFAKAIDFMNNHPKIGVISGLHIGGSVRHIPMGSGKLTRASIIRSFDRYWDIAPDSFINIKALKMGYNLKVLHDIKVFCPPSYMDTRKSGRFRNGRISYYVGANPLYTIFRAIVSKGSEYLRGYWQEWSRGEWRCEDPDVRDYYSNEFRRKLMNMVYDRRMISKLLMKPHETLLE